MIGPFTSLLDSMRTTHPAVNTASKLPKMLVVNGNEKAEKRSTENLLKTGKQFTKVCSSVYLRAMIACIQVITLAKQ